MQNKRIFYFDVLETVAIFLVLSVHGVWLNGNVASSVAMSIPPLAVPVFFMVHGALLLEKKYSPAKHLKRMKKVFFQLIVWTTIYLIFSICFGWETNSITLQFLNQYYAKGQSISGTIGGSLWFIYALLAVYFIFPLLSAVKSDIQTLKYVAKIIFLFTFATKEIDVWGSYIASKFFDFDISIKWWSSMLSPFGKYANCIFFFIIGYLLSQEHQKQKCPPPADKLVKNVLAILLGVLLMMIERKVEFGTYIYNWKPLSDQYSRLGTVLMATGLFNIISYINFTNIRCNLMQTISSHTIDIYYIHVIITRLLYVYLFKQQFAGIIPNTFRALIVLIVSFFIGQIIRKIPIIKMIL